MDIREQLRQFIIENFLYGQKQVFGDEDSFLDQGIIDSTGVLELVSFIEEHFGIAVRDTDLIPDNLDSIQRVTKFIQRKLVTRNGAA